MFSGYLTSMLLPVPHGFTTRNGGVSEGPYRSLNVSVSVGDQPIYVEENLSRVAKAVRLRAGTGFHTVSQVHGNAIVRIENAHDDVSGVKADALWTSEPEVSLGVKTADCVPVVMVDPRKKSVAAIHAGWRGADLRIVEKVVQQLEAHGSRSGDLLVAVGPSVRRCCYEVSDELAARFRLQFGAGVASSEPGKPHLDLVFAIRSSLLGVGVREENIDLTSQCTACDPENFFSHRRDRGRTGRHLNFVVCRF